MNIIREYRCEGCQAIIGKKISLFSEHEGLNWFEPSDGSCEENEKEWRIEVRCRRCNRKNHFTDDKIINLDHYG